MARAAASSSSTFSNSASTGAMQALKSAAGVLFRWSPAPSVEAQLILVAQRVRGVGPAALAQRHGKPVG